MPVRFEHLSQHPERYTSLTKDNIRGEIIVYNIDSSVVSKSLCESTTCTKEYWIGTSEDIEIYLFLSREGFWMMIYDTVMNYTAPGFYRNSLREDNGPRFLYEDIS